MESLTMRHSLDKETVRMYADYQGGMTLIEVGAKYGFHCGTVLGRFEARGFKRRSHAEHRRMGGLKMRAKLDALVAEMFRDYEGGMSLSAVAKKYGRDRRAVSELFSKRGYKQREWVTRNTCARDAHGTYLPAKPFTAGELDSMIRSSSRIVVPVQLKHEWRHWSLEKRGQFIARLRKHLALPTDRPERPFSKNVEPFDYASPRAQAIAAEMNRGKDSQHARAMIRVSSQGVIWKGRLYFWAADREHTRSGAYYIGPWTPDNGRPALHQIIWREHNGRPIPKGHVLRYVDGNPNNLLPENIVLATRNDVCRENQAVALLQKSRELTSILLKRSQTTSRNEISDRLLASPR